MAFKDDLAAAAQNIGAIKKIPGREGGDDSYQTASGASAVPMGDGSGHYRVPILNNVDANGTAGRGAYWAVVDSSGKQVADPFYQPTTNADWSGLVAFAATVAGSMALSSILGPGAEAGMLTTGAPISASPIASFGPSATASDVAAALAQVASGGALPAGFAQALAKLGPGILKAAGAMLPSGVKNIIDNLVNASPGMFDLIGGALQADGLIGASNTAADAYNTLGNQQFNDYLQHATNLDNRTQGIGNTLDQRYNALGDKAQGMLGDLATGAKTDYTNLGTAAAGVYNGIAGGTKTAYDNLLGKVEGTAEKFTPWNVTTNVGSTNKGMFTPTPGIQNVSDQATSAAGSSFGAANNIDVNNLAQQKFGQQKATLAPYDAQDLAKLRANLAATGRTGVASNATGQAVSPELAAYYLSKGTRDANLLTNADQAALNVRGGLVSQGTQASGVPLNIGTQGLSQIGTGISAGTASAGVNNQLASMLGNIGSRGIDAVTNAQTHGADSTLPIFDKAIGVPLGLQKEGIGTMLSQGNQGLQALTGQLNLGTNAISQFGDQAVRSKYSSFLKSIDQRYQGNLAKSTLMAKILSSLGGMSSTAARAAQSGDVSTLAAELLKKGMTQQQIDYLLTTGGVGSGSAVTDAVSGGNIANPSLWDDTPSQFTPTADLSSIWY